MRNNNTKTCTYYVDGMHCASCEVMIEKKLLKQKNIKSVDASLSKGRVDFEYEGEKPDPKLFTQLLSESGYVFSEKHLKTEDIPLIRKEYGKVIVNIEKLKSLFSSIGISILVIFLFYIVSNSGLAGKVSLNGSSSYISFFIFGLIAGLSSCAALVGGLLLSLTKQWNEKYIDSESKIERFSPFLMFNSGRILSFIILGGLLGALGSALGISITSTSISYGILVMLVSITMLVLGLQMLEVKWANKLRIAMPKFITKFIPDENSFTGKYIPFIIGALTFFLPCGFTLIAQGTALTSGSFLRGSLMMFSFVLGTLPVLAAISFASVSLSQRPKLNSMFLKVAGILVILFAVYNINSQLNSLGLFSLNDIRFVREEKNIKTAPLDSNGVQIVKIVAEGFEYDFEGSSTIKSGVPAKLIVTNKGVDGCAVALSARGLINGYVLLKTGENVIDIGSPSVGTYKITCSMGMVKPIILNVI